MAGHVAYFDESGDLETGYGVFCIAGYLMTDDAAVQMDQEWRAVLSHFDIPYFHMVECAHDPAGGVLKGWSDDKCDQLVRQLIPLIKKYVLEGYATILIRESESNVTTDDAYALAVEATLAQIVRLMDHQRIPIQKFACFFEDGHGAKGRAYNNLAHKLLDRNISINFEKKRDLPLLQAADLLAWQAAKYCKCLIEGRKIRGDFAALTQHMHAFTRIHLKPDSPIQQGIELFPLSRRPSKTVIYQRVDSAPIPFLKIDGDPVPMVPIEVVGDSYDGAFGSFCIRCETLNGMSFGLSFDKKHFCRFLEKMLGSSAEILSAEEMAKIGLKVQDLDE